MIQLLTHSLYSVARLMAGLAISVVFGASFGILIGYFVMARRIFMPVTYVLSTIPKVALLPLVMLMFGIGEESKVFMVFLVMAFQVLVAVTGAVANIPGEYYAPLKAVGAGSGFMMAHIVVPAILPELFTAIRVSFASGIAVLFFAETFGTRWGLGFYIMDMWMRLDYTRMAWGIAAMGMIGLLSASLTDLVEKRVCRWKSQSGRTVKRAE